MIKILKIQIFIFLLLTLLSLILQGTLWLPTMFLLSTIVGPFMAYASASELQTYIFITLGFFLAIIMMRIGIKYRTIKRGTILFTLGFWFWTFIGLIFGLSTGT